MKHLLACFLCCGAAAKSLNCDLAQYHGSDGLRAAIAGDALEVNWRGKGQQDLRARFAICGRQPVPRTRGAGEGANARSYAGVRSVSRRRRSPLQIDPLKALGVVLTPAW
jgi:hypothetical protein